MKYFEIELNKYYTVAGGKLTGYIADKILDRDMEKWKRPAVIVAPGGGYWFCSKREEEPVVFEFLAKGYNVFMLEYLCEDDRVRYPEQLLELACSVDYIRKNAKDFSVNSEEIFAVGFSAGGHLVANLSSDYTVAQNLYNGKINPKITAAGLIYPMLSDKYYNKKNKLRPGLPMEDIEKTRLDEWVCKKTVPAFIFSTFEDQTVPSMNALKYAEAMAERGITYELHVYKNGGHGMSVANAEINERVDGISRNKNWMNDCASFFRDYCKEKF